jgi:hypothetical protein
MQLLLDCLELKFPLTQIGRGGHIIHLVTEHLASLSFVDTVQIFLSSIIAHYFVSAFCKAVATFMPIMLTDVWTDL